MIQVLHYIFWICFGIIFYNYIGYGILLMLITRLKQIFRYILKPETQNPKPETQNPKPETQNLKPTPVTLSVVEGPQPDLPDVTLLVAAYNEEAVIEKKIANCLSLNYPRNKISFLFITDGSTDRTTDMIRRYPQIYLLDGPERKGKTAALNRAMQFVSTPITIFCDANTLLNRSAIRRIVAHYNAPQTGGVAGEKKVITAGNQSTVANEGLYWKYESLLKKLDASLYTVTGAAGELFSIRTILWTPMPENVILDDFVISARINLKGYRIAYEPKAYASELPSADLKEERKRKVRISEGAFQSMIMLKDLFNVFKHPLLFFQFFSHRFLRWTLAPLSFPLLLLANIFLTAYGAGIFYKITLIAQLAFYLLAGIGKVCGERQGKLKILRIFHYILFMNYLVYLGFFRFIKGKQSGVWEKAERKVMVQV